MKTNGEFVTDPEVERIDTLKKYNILDTPPDGAFDRITRLAAIFFNVPIALISIVDEDRIWFKSRYGMDLPQIERTPGLCSSAICSNDLYIVNDAPNDVRTLSNPLVADTFGLKFYAAAPLKVKEGHNLGTLCIIDKEPRELTLEEQEILRILGDIVTDEMEIRLSARKAIYFQNQLMNTAVHDLKNPLTTIPLWAKLIKQKKNNPEEIDKMCNKITDVAVKINSMLNNLMESAEKEAGVVHLRFQEFNLTEEIKRVIETNRVLADKKNQTIELSVEDKTYVLADKTKLSEVIDNLINNAIKYSHPGKKILILIKEENGHAIVKIKDEGQGLTEDDKLKAFHRFARLSSKPTSGETSTGLGLSIVKTIIDAHQGEIWVESEGKDKGATFIFQIPAIKGP